MWVCSQCGKQIEEGLNACSQCGLPRPVAELAASPVKPGPALIVTAELVAPPVPAAFFPVQIEPPRASALAVWVWVLAVFALAPLIGMPVAVALAMCSLLLVLRSERLPWDRRIGLTGLAISGAALAVLGLWVVMLFWLSI